MYLNRYFPFKFIVGEIFGKGAMALYGEILLSPNAREMITI